MTETESIPIWKGATDNEILLTIQNCPEDTEHDRGVKAALLWAMNAVDNPHPLDMENRLSVDVDGNCVRFRDQMVVLIPMEVEILFCLSKAFPNTATHREIKTSVWGHQAMAQHSVNVMVCNRVRSLRERLQPWDITILTVNNKGYRLVYEEDP